VYVVGLTGGIGSGKSTFALLLAERGAHIIDADELGRKALKPGRPAWHSVVDQFGDEILVPGTMDVDRKRLASIVFSDPNKLAALNAIVHPVILRGIADHLELLRNTDEVVVIDAALLVDMGVKDLVDALIVVKASPDARRKRLITRGMTAADIDARMAAQVSEEKLMERADIVVTNDRSLEHLSGEADRAWQEIQARKVTKARRTDA
jgi:dephospho-CoA kinase